MQIRHAIDVALRNRRTTSTAAVGLLACLPLAVASGAVVTRDGTELEEIVVTANKRTERLQDVAMSVSAVTGDFLAQTQAFDLQDIATKVSGLSLQQGGAPGLNRIIIRGQNSGGDATIVATLLDYVPLSFSAPNTNGGFLATDFDTYDLERVEVLRGPQGTLYGATAEGGLIKYVTKAPDLESFAAGFEASAVDAAHGDTGAAGKGYINVPLANGTAAFRASMYYDTVPGWVDNDQLDEDDLNEIERSGGRASFLWQPNETWSVRLTGLYQTMEQDGDNSVQMNGLSDPGNPFGLVDGYNYSTYTPNLVEVDTELYSLDIGANLAWASFQSITGFGEVDFHSFRDSSALANLFVPSSSVRLREDHGLEKFSQEFRLISREPEGDRTGSFDWQLGAFYTREETDFIQEGELLAQPAQTALFTLIGSSLPNRFTDLALYGDATYHFTPRFDLQFGARVSHNEQRSQLTQEGLLVGGGPIVNEERETSETTTTWQIAPRFRISDETMVYGRIATGYRPGGPALPIPGAPPELPTEFESDNTINYEVGFKGDLADGKVSMDLAAFYIDWSDIQIITSVVINGVNWAYTDNAGTAVSQGFEWNVGWTPFDGMQIGLVGAYTDAHLTKDAPALGASDGDELAYVPEFTNTLNVDYRWPVREFEAFVGGSWSYVGERYNDFPEHVELPDYHTYEARAGIENDRYSLQVFGKNLGDERGITGYGSTGAFGGSGYAALIRPRVIGIRFTTDF